MSLIARRTSQGGKLLRNKLLEEEYQKPQLKNSLRKFYVWYNELVSNYNVLLRHMLTDVFIHIRKLTDRCFYLFSTFFLPFFLIIRMSTRGCDRPAEGCLLLLEHDPTFISFWGSSLPCYAVCLSLYFWDGW